MNRKKVLVTGGVGFLGTHLVSYLLETGKYDIVIFDKLEHNVPNTFSKHITYCKGNIVSKEDVERAFRVYGPFTSVFHLAAAMPNKAVIDNVLWETNVTGTKNLIEKAV